MVKSIAWQISNPDADVSRQAFRVFQTPNTQNPSMGLLRLLNGMHAPPVPHRSARQLPRENQPPAQDCTRQDVLAPGRSLRFNF